METSFLLLFTFLFFQRFSRSSNTMLISSSNVTSCIERERQSLLAFKLTLIDRFNLLSTWSGEDCCEWQGVGCDSQDGHVVKLDLRPPLSLETVISDGKWVTFANTDKQLQGELSHSLQNLKHLRYLDLSMNNFSGNIPEFLGSFKYLEYLNLSYLSFTGVVPHHLGNLSRLQYLDLSYSNMEFPFSNSLIVDNLGWASSLSSLRHLDLSGITIGKHVDWFHPVNMIPSLRTLNLVYCDINSPSTKFTNFTSLNSLDLSFNLINSTIPVWLSNLTGLVYINLENNHFHGKIPEFLEMFNALASINLSENSFETLMPDLLCNLSSLVHLDLSANKFSGPIPASLGLLPRLEDLYLNYNQLNGNIPMSLSQLSKLKNLDLSSNSLVGVLYESHFTKLKNLNYLALSSNSLMLNFSSRWIAPFQLQIFSASSCNIGPYFPKWLHTQTNLQGLHLSNSSIRDTIPEWFKNILSHILHLDLSNNQISGKFEESLATLTPKLNILDLSDNLLSGHIPQTDETMNSTLETVNLSKNRFTGSIPVHLCKVPSIRLLNLSQNKFSGRLPRCLGNLINLLVIDLSYNNLTGVLPSSLGCLKYLLSLHLHNNRFEGGIPVSLQNLTELITMDLGNNLFTGTIPYWIGEKLSGLRFLKLKMNKFTNKIPLQLCKLNALQYLSLANNNITGTIPCCFRNLSAMITISSTGYATDWKYNEEISVDMKGGELLYSKTRDFLSSLDLSNNNIGGEIPDALMNLVGLINLKLSGNLLKGQIPQTIGELKQLESLDLSMNKLSGRIPESLTSLHFLSYLNLSFNNLSGPIPVGTQIQTLASDPSIFEGNVGLCGPSVSRSCEEYDASDNHVGKDVGQDDNEGMWFYAGMGPGFVVGFVGLLGSLHFIRRWRVAYFETLENVYGWLMLSILLNRARLRMNVFK